MNRCRVAATVAGMEPSVIKDMAVRAAHTPDAVSLAWGVPSFATPAPIRAAVSEALDQDPDIGRYSLPDGIVELRAAIAARHHEATGVLVDPDRQVLVTAGNMQAMSTMLKVLLEAGDEVIVTDPGFCSHVQQIELAGGVPRYWRLDEARHWQLDMDALPALVNRRTRAVIPTRQAGSSLATICWRSPRWRDDTTFSSSWTTPIRTSSTIGPRRCSI
jgi:aminotransferase